MLKKCTGSLWDRHAYEGSIPVNAVEQNLLLHTHTKQVQFTYFLPQGWLVSPCTEVAMSCACPRDLCGVAALPSALLGSTRLFPGCHISIIPWDQSVSSYGNVKFTLPGSLSSSSWRSPSCLNMWMHPRSYPAGDSVSASVNLYHHSREEQHICVSGKKPQSGNSHKLVSARLFFFYLPTLQGQMQHKLIEQKFPLPSGGAWRVLSSSGWCSASSQSSTKAAPLPAWKGRNLSVDHLCA